jgi:hypothetical protein
MSGAKHLENSRKFIAHSATNNDKQSYVVIALSMCWPARILAGQGYAFAERQGPDSAFEIAEKTGFSRA